MNIRIQSKYEYFFILYIYWFSIAKHPKEKNERKKKIMNYFFDAKNAFVFFWLIVNSRIFDSYSKKCIRKIVDKQEIV
jgi:hypothetical protein